jgi:hypothetical protein
LRCRGGGGRWKGKKLTDRARLMVKAEKGREKRAVGAR